MRRAPAVVAVFTLFATASPFAQIASPTPQRTDWNWATPASERVQQTGPTPQVPTASAKPVSPPVAFPADSKVGFIDLQTIVANSKLGKAGSAKMKVLTDKQAADLTAKGKSIQTLQQQMQQQTGVLSSQALQDKQAELAKLQRETQFAQQDWQAQVDSLNKQLLDDFEAKALPIVEEIRNEKGLLAIFTIPNPGIAAFQPGLDLSAEVVKRLDAKYPGGTQ